jgi:hypothetical protein
MTHIPGFLPKTTNDDPLARRALFVAFEEMGVFDLTGPLTVFWSASTFMKQPGPARLRPAYGQPRQLHACAQLNRTCLSHRRRSAFRAPGSAKGAAVTLVASIDVGRIPYAAFGQCRARCSFARGGLGKALSIVARRDSQYSEERTTHLLFAAEAATFSNSIDSVVRFLEPATRCVNSNRFHRLRGGAAALRCIDPHCGVSNMGRAIVEEIATLASLALFVGMVAIWAQVIATL